MRIKITEAMKRLIYNPAKALLAAILLVSMPVTGQEVTKEFHKEYTAGANTTLEVNNRYGKVVVETSDRNDIIIHVKVTVELPNQQRAEKLLSYIDVQFAQEGDMVKARTSIDDKFTFTGWGGGSRRFSIDYKISMPERINFTLVNRYGNSDLETITGLVKLDLKYGNLKAEDLSRGNVKPLNYINLAYGNATIESAGWLDVVLRYSGNFWIGSAQALSIDSKYSKISIDEVSSIVGETKYDKLEIETINNLSLDAGYTDANIGELRKRLKFDGGYGSLNIDRITRGFESIESSTKYIGVKLGIDEDASYRLDAMLSYGDLKFDEDKFRHQKQIVENNKREMSGVVGDESEPSSRVNITASYGSVRLY